ncbi:hypothetical protein GDO86_020188 [Hymenochirus boettgeri]|uniref:Taste receptor type 2 n=1 Tax=Hymenochirus boettgeri TaxID=247094 RepID=A0A8T2ICB6_9PIPI|nr:hypothetical protein GDO86_020188 [Hymenochirus boettgeri]
MGWEFITIQTISMVGVISGMVSNVFIMSVNVHSLMRGERMNPSDQITVALSFSNVIYSAANGLSIILVDLHLVGLYGVYSMAFLIAYSDFSNCWLGACLCFFYFVKIGHFHCGFLAQIKKNLQTLVPWEILTVQTFSVINSALYTKFSPVLLANQTSYSSSGDLLSLGLQSINCLIPSIIISITTGQIIVSLYKHSQHMRHNIREGGGPNLKVHQRATRTLVSLLIIYLTLFFLSVNLLFPVCRTIADWVCIMLTCFFPIVQSIIPVVGNSRLLKSCMKILNKVNNSP